MYIQVMTSIQDTFEEVAERVFTLLPKTQRVDFVNDCYYEHLIKTFERRHRGMSPTFLLSGPKVKLHGTGSLSCPMIKIKLN